MNNLTGELKNSGCTPVRRLGLSRKRKSSCLHLPNTLASPSENTENYSGTQMKKQNILSTEILKFEENFQNKSEIKSELEESSADTENKYVKKIKELEKLYSMWANGFKNALFYLVNLLEKKPGESVNVKQLLIHLRIWEIVSDHFKNDSDLSFIISEGNE